MSINRQHPFFRSASGDWWGENTPSELFDQHFGNVIDRHLDHPSLRHNMYMMPYWMRSHQSPLSTLPPPTSPKPDTGVSTVHNESDKFHVDLDVRHFSPEDITVKTVDNAVVVEAKHEEKMDEHGFVSRQFTRKYILPKEVDPTAVTSTLSPDGTLTIQAPKKMLEEANNQRTIPITFSPPPVV